MRPTPMVLRAARVLNENAAKACNVDAEDQWKVYGEDFILDAAMALDAAGANELLEALRKIAAYRPLTFAECSDAEAVIGIAENAIAKATGEAS